MSSANVVTHARFGAAERLKELQEQGIAVVEETRDYSEIDLPDPEYGEQIVGELTSPEKALFFALHDATAELEDATRTLMGNKIARVGETIRDSDRSKPLTAAMSDEDGMLHFENDGEAKDFFRLEKKVTMLHATLHWNLAERLDRHEFILGVRTRGRIVAKEKRY